MTEASATPRPDDERMRLSLRLYVGADATGDARRIGPGKITLLEAVGRTGSISAAGRALGMSYRRAWLLIDAVNRLFDTPAVLASAGGAQGGGASLTPFGEQLVAAYRRFEARCTEAAGQELAGIMGHAVAEPQPGSDASKPRARR